jgi:hypothetical protein
MDLLDLCEGKNECGTLLKNCAKKGLFTGSQLQASLDTCLGPVGFAAASHRLLYKRWGLLRPTSTPQEPRHTVQPPLQAGARSTRRGLRVGVTDSLGWSFVWGPSTVVDRSFRYTAKA